VGEVRVQTNNLRNFERIAIILFF